MTHHVDSHEMDSDRALEAWLEKGPRQLPDRAIEAIVNQLEQTNQRRHRLPRRLRMNRMLFAGAGVAAVLVLAFVGIRLYFGNTNGPGPAGQLSPSPSPTVLPSVSPSVSVANGVTGSIAVASR